MGTISQHHLLSPNPDITTPRRTRCARSPFALLENPIEQLQLPQDDSRFPSYVTGDGRFESDSRFFDFSGVDTLPLEEYEGLSQNPDICEPRYTAGGMGALFLTGKLCYNS